jgi:hypothetical protein
MKLKRCAEALVLSSTLAVGLALLPAAALARATGRTSNTTVPLAMTALNPCSGEEVVLSGEMHILSHFTADASGGTHVVTHAQGEHVDGVGASGTEYHGNMVDVAHASDPDGDQTNFTHVFDMRLVSQGSSDNFLVHALAHVTFNADGEPTATFVGTSAECRG